MYHRRSESQDSEKSAIGEMILPIFIVRKYFYLNIYYIGFIAT